jgi:hypothetical protein
MTLRELQDLRLVMYTKDDSYYHGANKHADLIDVLDELIEARELCEDNRTAAERLREQDLKIEQLKATKTELLAYIQLLEKPNDPLAHYKQVIRENSQGYTVAEWRSHIQTADIEVGHKEELFKMLADPEFTTALVENGEIDPGELR